MAGTVLLIHCDGTTFTDSATGKTVTPVGSAAVSSAQAAALTGNTSSGLFDGSGDYLSIADHADFVLGSSDFTIEFWYRPSAIGVAQQLCTKRASTSFFAPWLIQMDATGKLLARASVTGAAWAGSVTTSITLTANTWYHVALCRSGTSFKLYVNGTSAASGTLTGTLMTNTAAVLVGGDTNNYSVNGHIDEVRISAGVARYTADFTVPTSPFTMEASTGSEFSIASASALTFSSFAASGSATFSIASASAAAFAGRNGVPKTAILMHLNGAEGGQVFTEEVGRVTDFYGNVKTTGAVSPVFGLSSAYLDGTGDVIEVKYSADMASAATDFTFEMWVRPENFFAQSTLIVQRLLASTKSPFLVQINTDGTVSAYFSTDNSTWALTLTTVYALTANVWTHLAVCRDNGVMTIYVDGVSRASGALSTNLMGSSYSFYLGGDLGGNHFKGYIDEFRYTTQCPRYRSDFTVPTVEFSKEGINASAFSISTGSVFVPHDPAGEMSFSLSAGSTVGFDGALVNTRTAFLLHMDGPDGSNTFVDECKNRVVRIGSPVVSSAQGKYSSQSALFDGVSGLEIHGTGPTFNIGTGQFLFEAWIYPTSRVAANIFTYGTCALSVLANGHLYAAYHFSGGTNENVSLEYLQAIPLNTWTHVAFGADWYGTALYVNGAREVSYSATGGALYADGANDWRIIVGQYFVGHIDEARFTNGLNPYYSAYPILEFHPTAPFKIPDSTTSAFFIDEGATTSFIAAPNVPGLTSFSIQSGSTTDLKVIGIRTVAREFNIDTGTTTHLDGWLLIGAETYFDIQAGSDFWFKSPGAPVSLPSFHMDCGSTVNFASPPQPVAKASQFYLPSGSAFAPRAEVQRGGKFLMWEGSVVKWATRQNAPYVFAVQCKSTPSFKSSALVASRFSIGVGSQVSGEGRGLAPSRFDIATLTVSAFNSRRYNGGAYAIAASSSLNILSSQGYTQPPLIRETAFIHQRAASTRVMTRPNTLHVREAA